MSTSASESTETLVGFFQTLRREIQDTYSDFDEVHENKHDNVIPISLLARFFYDNCNILFSLQGDTNDDILEHIEEKIRYECASVQAYYAQWSNSGMCSKKPDDNVADTVSADLRNRVFPWPQISEHPAPEREDGRLVKSFPLTFPAGQGDFRQPRKRDDFTGMQYVQHMFRYYTGHVVRSSRGQREMWAMFNLALREIAYDKRSLVYRNTHAQAVTKAELQQLVAERDNLVHSISSYGADIPTTSMFWNRKCKELEWIVRQMSWPPPWTTSAHDNQPLAAKRMRRHLAQKIHSLASDCDDPSPPLPMDDDFDATPPLVDDIDDDDMPPFCNDDSESEASLQSDDDSIELSSFTEDRDEEDDLFSSSEIITYRDLFGDSDSDLQEQPSPLSEKIPSQDILQDSASKPIALPLPTSARMCSVRVEYVCCFWEAVAFGERLCHDGRSLRNCLGTMYFWWGGRQR